MVKERAIIPSILFIVYLFYLYARYTTHTSSAIRYSGFYQAFVWDSPEIYAKSEEKKKVEKKAVESPMSFLLASIERLQQRIHSTQATVIYNPNVESGLANVIIGLVSCIIASLSTNRGIQIHPSSKYLLHFNSPFSNFVADSEYLSNASSLFMYASLAQGRFLKHKHINSIAKRPAVVVDCFTNTTSHFLNNSNYAFPLQRLHLYGEPTSPESVVNLLYEVVMSPKEDICNVIQGYETRLQPFFVIGVQVRIGGQHMLYKDKQFLHVSDMFRFIEVIDRFMVEHDLPLSQCRIFLSTDRKSVATQFARRFGDQLVVVSEYTIGHSAMKKNNYNMKDYDLHMKRAIVDLLLLKDADFLLYTKDSSFGALAAALQSNHHAATSPSAYSAKCPIFHRNRKPIYVQVIGPST